MSHMDYQTLIGSQSTDGSIKNYVNMSTTPSAQIVHEAEQWIYQRLRAREMVAYATGTWGTSDAGVLTLPTRYRAPIFMHFTGANRVFPKRVLLDAVRARFAYDGDGNRTQGAPRLWATDATNVVFDTVADQDYTYEFVHYADLAALDPDNQTNFLTDRYPRLLRIVCQAFAYEFHEEDERAIAYLTKAEKQIFEAEKDKDLEMMGIELEMQIDGAGDGIGGFGNL